MISMARITVIESPAETVSLSRDRDAVIRMLADRRRELGLSQIDLCRLINTGQNMISHWETGRHDPRLSKVLKWADALGYELVIRPRRGE